MSVDVPEPFWPISAWISPGATSIATSSRAFVPGNVLETSEMRSRADDGAGGGGGVTGPAAANPVLTGPSLPFPEGQRARNMTLTWHMIGIDYSVGQRSQMPSEGRLKCRDGASEARFARRPRRSGPGRMSNPGPVGQQRPVPCRAAEQRLVGLRPPQVQVRVVLPGEADAAVDLDVPPGTRGEGIRRLRLGDD